ncbi:MAG TPA: plastocyanin/azurin family copper-binding protein [Longimicrobium sp.]|nr:plastocyanin/azurin family copper-binding protein [Longimicrobium sp.]
MRSTYLTTFAAALVLGQAACTVDKAADESRGTREAYAQTPAATANLVTITATEFAFAAPASVPAGLTTVRVIAQGAEFHHVQLVRLDPGHTVDELMQATSQPHAPIPAWAHFVGGPNAPAPGGGQSEATLELKAGEYALVCLIPSRDGVPHMMKGMVKPLTVTPAEEIAPLPAADVRLTLRDYSFEFAPELAAGRHTVRVENAAAQPHEVVLMKLAPGKTAQDLMAWMQTEQGPPPAMPMGGTTLLSTGESNNITVDVEPGEYALLCFVPDAKDGKPHVAHGMVRQITVR